MQIGYHCSHEQFSPARLLSLVELAEQCNFDFALSSDHFHPWSTKQGHSGFAWSWLGAAMAKTSLPFGIVNCPLFRYHPALIAQAAATLDSMFPKRFWIAVGSGQLLNEGIIADRWPPKSERNSRLKEGFLIIKELWNGKIVTRNALIKIEEARLYTQPKCNIPLLAAAITPQTASFIAPWADGLITISQPEKELEAVINAWRSNGGSNKPMYLKIQLSYDKNEELALSGAFEQWKFNVFGSDLNEQLRTPEQFEQAAVLVNKKDIKKYIHISSELGVYEKWLNKYKDLGFEKVILHNVNTNQELFIKDFGKNILPLFQR